MLGLSYFAVPLYRLFCSATGYGGTVSEGWTVEQKIRQRLDNPDMTTEECAAISKCAHCSQAPGRL
jgi:cytochrome c oxidase assembly protein subunit 11